MTTDKPITVINLPPHTVYNILSAAGGTVIDPFMFGEEHRRQVHKEINKVIDNIEEANKND